MEWALLLSSLIQNEGGIGMKIAWFCIPAHGHVNPTLGLVKEMTDAGHEVYYFSFKEFKEEIEEAGGFFICCDGYDLDIKYSKNSGKVGKDIAFSMGLIVSSTLALDEMVMRTVNEIKPDIIVSDSVAYWGKLAAMKCNIPYISSTTTFAFNKYSAKYIRRGFGEILKMFLQMPRINKQIKRLRDNGYLVKNILDIIQNDNETNTIVYTSKYFQPCSETFSDKYCFIGPSLRSVKNIINKTAEKTIFISMGTVVKNEKFINLCIDALKETDYQIIVSLGKNNVCVEDIPDNVQIYEFVDQMAALMISDVFITHCGMNSVSEGLYFGVPLILCPQTPEQMAPAKRTEELGAGIILKANKKANILAAVNQIFNDSEYRKRAEKISESFKKSGGVKKARAFLEAFK